MRTEILQLASELAGRSEAFALATVVRREPPSSARVGDSAVVTPDGEFHGWLGGSCTRPTVIREALAALADEKPRLIGIVRDPDSISHTRPGLTVFPMACHSGGSVEIYIEPLLPARRLLIFGVSPTARALARLAAVLGYRVEAVDPEASETLFPDAGRLVTSDESVEPPGSAQDASRCFAVVATLGQRDEEAAWTASRLMPAYVGVVASRKRFGQMRETLAARGATQEQLDRIANPAGLDIGAETPEEIALSILAEITRRVRAEGPRQESDRRPGRGSAPPAPATRTEQAPAPAATVATARESGPGAGPASPAPVTRTEQDPFPPAAAPETARDPVCDMSVAVAAASHQADVGGRTYYFCCAHCREQFLAEPQKYAAAAAPEG
ncbi:MAG: YHS domain-containing protein [Acidobacteria bacterium]|nr:YHS domain-containing protein [Acidobacteriota bacterium]